MSKKRTKKRTKKKGPKGGTPRTVHHLLHPIDVKAWGSSTMCGKRAKAGTKDHTKVTCKACRSHTNWTIEQARRSNRTPLVLCCTEDKCDCLLNTF